MLDIASPRAIYDVHAASWRRITADRERYAALVAWAREQGLAPEKIYRIEVYLIDCPFARVFEYALNEQGDRYRACEGESAHDHECQVAKREPYIVPLTRLPEQEMSTPRPEQRPCADATRTRLAGTSETTPPMGGSSWSTTRTPGSSGS